MSYDGQGNFTPLSPQYPAISGTVIFAADWNAVTADIAAGISLAITRDGQGGPTVDIPWGGHKITNLGNGAAATDAVNFGQVFTNPVFTAPTVFAAPAANDSSLLIPSTGWVQNLIIQPIYAAAVIPIADNSQRLATTAYVRTLAFGPYQTSAANIYNFMNF